jgi:hypothetical protein
MTLITIKDVIPAKAGIQKDTGFRSKPGMTNHLRLISSSIGFGFNPMRQALCAMR